MIKKVAVLAAALTASIATIAPASAATITYTVSGNFTGLLNGQAFETPATFTGVGDTDNAFDFSGNITVNPLTSLSAVAGGITYNITNPSVFFVNRGEAFGGFSQPDGFNYILTFTSAAFELYDGISNLALSAGTQNSQPFDFLTDQGAVQISNASNLGVAAETAVAAVPEPATWAMMILGFGVIGFGMRYGARRSNAKFDLKIKRIAAGLEA